MTNQEITKLLRNVAAALIIQDANHFRITAYQKAADAIEHLTSDLKDVWQEGKLEDIPGVGKNIAGSLEELYKTGKVKHFQDIFKGISPAVFMFLDIPGVGPKRAYELTQKFKINNPKTAIADLEKVATTGKIAQLEGWGEKSQQELLAAIQTYKRGQIKENRMNLPTADGIAHEVMKYLSSFPQVARVDFLGSLRRRVATIGDIDLSVATNDPQKVIKAFVSFPQVKKIIDQGEKGATVLLSSGKQVDLRVQTPQSYGAMLQYFTGSKHHNIKLRELALKKGLSLSEYGIKPLKRAQNSELRTQNYNKKLKIYEFAKEEDFYQALDMQWIPPELREDQGEIELARQHKLPRLVQLSEIKGDLHVHSDFDLKPSHDLGNSSLEEILNQAVKLKYKYIGISDHNPKVSDLTENEIVKIMKRRREVFEQIYYSWKKRVKKWVHLLIMLEIDINPEGKLALPQSAFPFIDAAIVSIHSSFNQSKKQMTDRIIKGLTHPKAKILGHPTTRNLGKREEIEADWPSIFGFCKDHNKAVEINAWPERLDLPDRLVKLAVETGVKLIINTDSHDVEQMPLMEYGVDVARRGWAKSQDILNTMEYNKLFEWIKS